MNTVPADIRTFGELVTWLIETHHDGNRSAMARKLRVSVGLVWHWRQDLVKQPTPASVERLCRAYKLDYWAVMALVLRHPLPAPIAGGSSNDGTLPISSLPDVLSLIRHWVTTRRAAALEWLLAGRQVPATAGVPKFAPLAFDFA